MGIFCSLLYGLTRERTYSVYGTLPQAYNKLLHPFVWIQESLFWRRDVFPRCCHHQLICTWKVNGDGDRGADVKTDGRCLLVVTRLCVANRLQPMQCQCLFIYFWSRDYSVAYRWQPIKCRCFFLKDVGRTTYEDVLLCFCAVTFLFIYLFIYLFNYQW